MAESINLLCVDDDAHFRNGLRRILHVRRRSPEISFDEADCGRAALDALAARGFDCVLLDYQMPGGDGVEWLGRIVAQHPEVAPIIVTGKGDEATAVEAMKAGAMDYLVKGNIQADALVRSVLNAVEKRHLQRRVEEQQAKLLEAERQRVMIESLGAACHHLGQPTTVILGYLSILKRQLESSASGEMVAECFKAASNIADILRQLQRFSNYRTEPYLADNIRPQNSVSSNIIRIPEPA